MDVIDIFDDGGSTDVDIADMAGRQMKTEKVADEALAAPPGE